MSSSARRPQVRHRTPPSPSLESSFDKYLYIWDMLEPDFTELLLYLCKKLLRLWLWSIIEVCCCCQLISVMSGWWQIYSKEICDTEWEIERCQLYENLGTLIRPWWALNMEAPLNASALPLGQSKLFYWQNTKLTKRFSTSLKCLKDLVCKNIQRVSDWNDINLIFV